MSQTCRIEAPAHFGTYALPTGTYSTGWYEAVKRRFIIPDDDGPVRVRNDASKGKSPSDSSAKFGLGQPSGGAGRMRSSRTAIQGRHSEGDQRAGIRRIAESPLIVLLAVLISVAMPSSKREHGDKTTRGISPSAGGP